MSWRIETRADAELEDVLTGRLVEHNIAGSDLVRLRFEPGNLASRPVAAFALADGTADRSADSRARLLGGCTGHTEDVWQWLTVDTMWVRPDHRGTGLGTALLTAVEDEARARGCRWAKLNTWDFQAPGFNEANGYVEYGRELDYPPGHVNHLMRKEL
ncbi:MAG: GNAT family N-acetyltransferase [Nocardioides sp.]